MSDLPLKDRIALVVGASRGIGYESALALAKAGAHVVAAARTQGGLEELDDAIYAATGKHATLIPFDLVDGGAIDRLGGALFERFGRPVLVKGGSALPGALDLLIDGHGAEFPLALADAPLVTRSTHGAGCTLSAALTALLARGHSLREAAVGAKQFVFGAIRHAPGLGSGGAGPVDHGWLRRHGPGGAGG